MFCVCWAYTVPSNQNTLVSDCPAVADPAYPDSWILSCVLPEVPWDEPAVPEQGHPAVSYGSLHRDHVLLALAADVKKREQQMVTVL